MLDKSTSALIEALPYPQKMIGSRMVIQGASGAGKTYAIRKISETTHGLMQHLVLDVEDELFTLRERFDYVLIGGDHADAPLGDGAQLARTLLELGVSAIIALNDLPLAAQRIFIRDFVGGLMAAPKELWHPVLVVLDEAHRYAPISATTPCSEALGLLATAGRKRGYGAIFATQRLSQLSTDVRGQCPNRVIGRVDQALDVRIGADTLGFAPSSNQARALLKLQHEFWIVGPALAHEPRLVKFAETQTTHLEAGGHNVPTPPPARHVAAVLAKIAQRATQIEPRSPGAATGVTPARELAAAEKRGFEKGRAEGEALGREKALAQASAELGRLAAALLADKPAPAGAPRPALQEPDRVVRAPSAPADAGAPRKRQLLPTPADVAASPTPAKISGRKTTGMPAASAGANLPVAAAAFLDAAVGVHPVKLTWGQLGALRGRRARGGSFQAARKYLTSRGYVTMNGATVVVSPAGFAVLGRTAPRLPPTARELLAMILTALPKPAAQILEAVATSPQNPTTEEVARQVNRQPRGGSWTSAMAILRRNSLIGEIDGRWKLTLPSPD